MQTALVICCIFASSISHTYMRSKKILFDGTCPLISQHFWYFICELVVCQLIFESLYRPHKNEGNLSIKNSFLKKFSNAQNFKSLYKIHLIKSVYHSRFQNFLKASFTEKMIAKILKELISTPSLFKLRYRIIKISFVNFFFLQKSARIKKNTKNTIFMNGFSSMLLNSQLVTRDK